MFLSLYLRITLLFYILIFGLTPSFYSLVLLKDIDLLKQLEKLDLTSEPVFLRRK